MKTLIEIFYPQTMKDPELMKTTRKALCLNQSQMAERLGYGSQTSISDIETGNENMSLQVRKHLYTIRKYECGEKAG